MCIQSPHTWCVLVYRDHFVFRSTVEEETLSTAQALLSKQSYRDLIDFDNHLDDFKNDWRNLGLNELISSFV